MLEISPNTQEKLEEVRDFIAKLEKKLGMTKKFTVEITTTGLSDNEILERVEKYLNLKPIPERDAIETAGIKYESRYEDAEGPITAHFNAMLNYLSNYGRANSHVDSVKATLYPDFAPMSFGVTVEWFTKNSEIEIALQGGLIYHGPSLEEFDRDKYLADNNYCKWGVHT